MNKTILVVDDDRDIVRLIMDSLKYEDFHVIPAYSGKEAFEKLQQNPAIDFMILDIMMPEMDGLEFCRTVRHTYHHPIMFLSAKDRDIDKVIGLEIGADDYMTKPFSIQELISRVKAHFRRTDRIQQNLNVVQPNQDQESADSDYPLNLNVKTYEAFLYGDKLELSTKEFQILHYLFQHPNQVLTREQIYESVWGDEFGDINTVTVHIKNIRKKLGKEFEAIRTIWGVGYKFVFEGANG
ncbi:response regulator transcription factor [Cytobacillus spongiae]|uniref:response regulator transcription factor n=1 Tax=Cytobacillus spongiae TaxID=2901381 RepID=UPI001F316540|nr:response regulator transcription factor [Cytobacillus spongiae]UII56158.1 response regulator transcription factor [Cytobacillus spongiae]